MAPSDRLECCVLMSVGSLAQAKYAEERRKKDEIWKHELAHQEELEEERRKAKEKKEAERKIRVAEATRAMHICMDVCR